jgi:hypothetical protein
MSQESIELVRRHLEPYDGEDIVPVLSEAVDRLGPAPEPEAVLTLWAQDPSFRHLHPEAVWEIAVGGPLDVKATGPTEITRWWAEWLEVWESYVYRAVEYRDSGEWVLSPVDARATGRGVSRSRCAPSRYGAFGTARSPPPGSLAPRPKPSKRPGLRNRGAWLRHPVSGYLVPVSTGSSLRSTTRTPPRRPWGDPRSRPLRRA